MIYEQDQIKKIAEKARRFILENHLAEEFIERLSQSCYKGSPIPKMVEIVDNGCLREELFCFLCSKNPILQNAEQKRKGDFLIKDLERIGRIPRQIKGSDMEQAVWEVAELLKDLDYFKYAEYMKCMDNPADPVRRIYMDLKVPEKRMELADYLLEFTDTEHMEKIQSVAAKLEDMDSKVCQPAAKKEDLRRR